MKKKQYSARLLEEYIEPLLKKLDCSFKDLCEQTLYPLNSGESGFGESNHVASFSPDMRSPDLPLEGNPDKVCHYGTEIRSDIIYCDNPRKKNLPKNKELLLIVCNQCYERREYVRQNKPRPPRPRKLTRGITNKYFDHPRWDLISCPLSGGKMIAQRACGNCQDYFSCPSVESKLEKMRNENPIRNNRPNDQIGHSQGDS